MEEVRPRPTAMHFLTHMHPDLTPAQILEMVRMQTAPEDSGGDPGGDPGDAVPADDDRADLERDLAEAEVDLQLDDEDDVDVDEDDVDVDEDDGEFLWLDEEGADDPGGGGDEREATRG